MNGLENIITGFFMGFAVGIFTYYLLIRSKQSKKAKQTLILTTFIYIILMTIVMVLDIIGVIK